MPQGSQPRKRFLVYAQHLSGVGHFMRTLRIAEVLSGSAEVYFLCGGRPVPHLAIPSIHFLDFPPVARKGGNLVSLDESENDISKVFCARREKIVELFATCEFDGVVIEHFPFSKWDLETEIHEILRLARKGNPDCVRVCSIRDIVFQTRHEAVPAAQWEGQVLGQLSGYFDQVLVHGDEGFCALGESCPWAGKIPVPVKYTGIVSASLVSDPGVAGQIDAAAGGRPYILVSAGGGVDAMGLRERCVEAWRLLRQSGALAGYVCIVVTGVDDQTPSIDVPDSTVFLPFVKNFPQWLERAALSISCSGYNTCADIIRTGVNSLLLPNTEMSDQLLRARAMEKHGLARLIDPGASAAGLAGVINTAIDNGCPNNGEGVKVDVDGAAETTRIMLSL